MAAQSVRASLRASRPASLAQLRINRRRPQLRLPPPVPSAVRPANGRSTDWQLFAQSFVISFAGFLTLLA